MSAATGNSVREVAVAQDTADLVGPRDACARLTPFGWRGGLAALVAGLAASFFLVGYFVVYWRNADMDFMVVYSALAANAGKPLAFFDHPAYLTILSVEWWFAVLHRLGLLDAWSLSQIPSATDAAAFDAAMTHAIRAARVLSFILALGFILSFAALARRLTRDWRLALLATLAFAFSGGMILQMRIMRSEMIAACLVVLPLMGLMIAGRAATAWRPLVFALAACSCVLALENKIHAILMIAAVPVIILPFGTAAGASVAFWRQGMGRWLALGAALLTAAIMVRLALPLLATGLDPAQLTAADIRPLFSAPGIYQAGLMAWIGLGMLAFARLWRVSAAETLTAMALVTAGAAAGLLALGLQFNAETVVFVVNPLEKMLTFAGLLPPASANSVPAAGAGLASAPLLLLSGVVGVLRRYTFILYTSPRPAVFLTWLIVPGIVLAWRRGERAAALQASLLILTAIGIDALGMQRNLKPEYFTFTDPLIILAGVMLLARMPDLRVRRFAYPIGLALVVLHIGISQAEPVRHMLKRESAADGVCDWNVNYMPLLPLPWCDLPPKRP
jgi:hypothetical protein